MRAISFPGGSRRRAIPVVAALAVSLTTALIALPSPASGVAGFGDVPAMAYYTEPVQWMVDNEITTGTSPTCFSPDDPVTRGQAAAFMWRMEGRPAATPHSFDDVLADWQQGPVSWLAAEGITTGTSPTTFSPDDPLNRGQLAALLHRLAGEPPATNHPFADVVRPWQHAPVAWMLAEGITTGTSPTAFSPDAIATRGQVATFLYRYQGEPTVEVDPNHPTAPACAAQVDGPGPTSTAPTTLPPGDDVVVAFIGDQGAGSGARDVLELIRDTEATMVIHPGDFDYRDDPDAWDEMITEILGDDFPYFITVGNHDTVAWDGPDGYQAKMLDRLAKVPDVACSGDLGVNGSCTYRGLFIVMSGVGLLGSDHAAYIETQLAAPTSDWRICTWHVLQKEMQIGGKKDEANWEVYEACREGGAIVATAHEHNYARTTTLIDMSEQTRDLLWSDPDEVRVAPGATFAFISGLGGRSVRDQERCLPTTPPYGCDGVWASIYASQQGATDGALFCNFGPDATATVAECWFEDVDGNVPDRFTITNQN